MNNKNQILSRGQKTNSMLDHLLTRWELDYTSFCKILKINYKTLWSYRQGLREFRLNAEQMQELDRLLEKVEMRIKDLPLDWYLDKDQDENTWQEQKEKN